MPNQKTARECARAVIKNYANPSPDRCGRAALILHALIWQRTRAKRVCVPSRSTLFFSRDIRKKKREHGALIWATATTTRHNSKTTIIKVNSKEVVYNNGSLAVNERHMPRFKETFSFVIHLFPLFLFPTCFCFVRSFWQAIRTDLFQDWFVHTIYVLYMYNEYIRLYNTSYAWV